MTNFKQYFKSHLKENIKTIIYILVAVMLLTFLLGNIYQRSQIFNTELKKYEESFKSTLYLPVIFMCILAYIIPVMEFSFFKKRINLDCAYSMPISRKAMGAVHYLVGLLMIVLGYSASYLTNFVMLLSRGPGWFDFASMIWHYMFCLAIGVAVYSFLVFVFNEANTRGDGIWFMILYTFIFNFGLCTVAYITDIKAKDALGALPFYVLTSINKEFQSFVELNQIDRTTFSGSETQITWFVFWIVIGIASAVAFFLTFGKRRMEKTEEISNSYFGFRTLIPIYALIGMIYLNASSHVVVWVIVELLTFIGYAIYRRGLHYKKSDIAILCLLALFLFI